ncbi:MAG TPA: F0F1 ATP synthase subunit A [Thermodesulfobacteriota bacterium]|nr:F0F1 ATP synthase subunit A [Deltaproteobacteria bacterium]HNU70679.1 F0F1 ATP synthase subunit A [Thermodesulfobacteriota bacterium]
MEHPFTWLGTIPYFTESPERPIIATTIFVAVLLFIISIRVVSVLKKSSQRLVPEGKLSFRNFFEVVVLSLVNLLKDIIGPHGEKYLPLIGGLFVFILFCNILGLIPGFLPPTANPHTNAALALIVFLYYNYQGFKEHGIGYLKHFAGPLIYIAPLMIVIELVSHFFRPLSLTVRLFGNIFGDHEVMGIFSGLVPLIVPVIFLILGLMVCMIQAFVFAVLSAVYIGLAASHEH